MVESKRLSVVFRTCCIASGSCLHGSFSFHNNWENNFYVFSWNSLRICPRSWIFKIALLFWSSWTETSLKITVSISDGLFIWLKSFLFDVFIFERVVYQSSNHVGMAKTCNERWPSLLHWCSGSCFVIWLQLKVIGNNNLSLNILFKWPDCIYRTQILCGVIKIWNVIETSE